MAKSILEEELKKAITSIEAEASDLISLLLHHSQKALL